MRRDDSPHGRGQMSPPREHHGWDWMNPDDPGNRHRGLFGDLPRFIVRQAEESFEREHPNLVLSPVVALITAYQEEGSIAHVLDAMVHEAHGLPVTTLVVVDGGGDRTEEIARSYSERDVVVAALPLNQGQGIALRLGYHLAITHGAEYIVTLDADGQNDPAEIPNLLAPLLDGSSDFVVASRRLGTDHTRDSVRRLGVLVFGKLISWLIGQHLTDTSNGYRAIRAEILKRVHLEQEQYQTAELIISAAHAGARITEVPTVWHPRASGHSKKGSNATFAFHYAFVIARTWAREHRG